MGVYVPLYIPMFQNYSWRYSWRCRAAPLYTNGFFEERAEVIFVIHNEDYIFQSYPYSWRLMDSSQAWGPLACAYFII